MEESSEHLKGLKDTGERLVTAEGKTVEVWNFHFNGNDEIISDWAKHFRNQYCLDCEIDFYRKGYDFTRAEYLERIKFPDQSTPPGPSIRAGDFGEILVADYLQFLQGYWVPRTRYSDKTIRNESTKGCDILGFKFIKEGKESKKDTLAIYEAKTQFSGKKPKPRLQEAIDGSAKDLTRRAESLNAVKQRLFQSQQPEQAIKIERFQNPEDHPYTEIWGAAALFLTSLFDRDQIKKTNLNTHQNPGSLVLLVIHGEDMMKLVHQLYRRAMDEA